ncbi:transient receptor potential cation channel subfamily M member 2-like [Pleurodeles waltl]|uniref:transient receptor potential cation channel subfamily M member 2-like n=1 Tax=Pleurodeles waltl TaxID=8319 RepID=UPI0037096506
MGTFKAVIRGEIKSIACYKRKLLKNEISCLEEEMLKKSEKLVGKEEMFQSEAVRVELAELRHRMENILQARMVKRSETSKLKHFEYGENSGKLLPWKSQSDQVRNYIKEIDLDESGVKLTRSEDIDYGFQIFFAFLYTESEEGREELVDDWLAPDALPEITLQHQEFLNGPITIDEVRAPLFGGKDGKASGHDDIPVELYKVLGDIIIPILTELFGNISFNEIDIPTTWNEAIITLILKPGKNPTKCASGWERKLALYADDLLVFTDNLSSAIPEIFRLAEGFGKVSGYQVNVEKTEIMAWNMEYKSLYSKKEIRYLGVLVTQDIKQLVERNQQKLLLECIFSECCRNNRLSAEKLLRQKSSAWGNITCLQQAMNTDARSFMSNGGVQMFLTRIWWGKLCVDNTLFRVLICILLFPLACTNILKFRWKFDLQICLPRLKDFFTAPVVIFHYNVASYISFLILFAYVLIIDFQTTPSWAEGLLYFWIFTLLVEELWQVRYDFEGSQLMTIFRMYFTKFWNQMDVLALLLFLLGLMCRCITVAFYAGRVILALDYIIFCLRLMHIFSVSKDLGPKIIMLKRMMKDTFFFLFLLAVWIVSYGVAKQAILVHNEHRLDWIARSVIYEPYLTLFGHIPDDVDKFNFNNSTCTADGSDMSQPKCVQTVDGVPVFPEWLAISLLCLYLLLANILLLNLLIAMFSHTFSDVQDQTDQIWKLQHHDLVIEYSQRLPAPPPLIFFCHAYLFFRWLLRKIRHYCLIKKRE